MKPKDSRNSCPRQGWSRVKFPHAWYQEPKGSPQQILLWLVVCWVQSIDWYCDASMSSKWVWIQPTAKNLPIFPGIPMVHTRDHEPVTLVVKWNNLTTEILGSTPLVFIHWWGFLRPADETLWWSKQLPRSRLVSCECFSYSIAWIQPRSCVSRNNGDLTMFYWCRDIDGHWITNEIRIFDKMAARWIFRRAALHDVLVHSILEA